MAPLTLSIISLVFCSIMLYLNIKIKNNFWIFVMAACMIINLGAILLNINTFFGR